MSGIDAKDHTLGEVNRGEGLRNPRVEGLKDGTYMIVNSTREMHAAWKGVDSDVVLKFKMPREALSMMGQDGNIKTLVADFNGAATNRGMPHFGREVSFEVEKDQQGKVKVDENNNVTVKTTVSSADAQRINESGGLAVNIQRAPASSAPQP